MNRKPARLAVATLVAVLSVFGLSQAAPGGVASARTGGSGWCC
ncbi:hypothetical protein [Nocardioides anomalus]|nr:hypothetical protein [Nocardioides anomalus]